MALELRIEGTGILFIGCLSDVAPLRLRRLSMTTTFFVATGGARN